MKIKDSDTVYIRLGYPGALMRRIEVLSKRHKLTLEDMMVKLLKNGLNKW